MGNYMLCRRPAAKVSYYIESVQLNIYSIEELSYFLGNFLPLADESVVNKKLAVWIGEQCRMPELQRSFTAMLNEGDDHIDALKLLLRESRYYTNTQLEKIYGRINEMQLMTVMEKRKVRADLLMRQKKYRSAAADYNDIIHTPGITGETKEFRMKVYYDLGCAYAKLFRISKAKLCFRKAAEVMPCEETRRACLAAAYIEGGKDAFEREVERFGVEAGERNKVLTELLGVEVPDIEGDVCELGKQWAKDYHQSTGL